LGAWELVFKTWGFINGNGHFMLGIQLGIGDAQNFNQLVEKFSSDLFGMHG
jgi:hypothetical protein